MHFQKLRDIEEKKISPNHKEKINAPRAYLIREKDTSRVIGTAMSQS